MTHTVYVYPENLRPFLRLDLPHYPYACDYGIIVDEKNLQRTRPQLKEGTQLRPYICVPAEYDPEKPRPRVLAK